MSAIGRYSGKPTGGNPGFSSSVHNGQIPTSLLYHLTTQKATTQFPEAEHYLAHDAGVNFDTMVRAAKADGVTIQLLEAYRTLAKQNYFWDQYLHHGGNLAARPGTSNHGWGTAIDVDRSDPHTLPWMRLHATRYGWDLPDELGKREPWHWQAIVGHPVGATLPPVQETPVYVHGELLAGAFASRTGGSVTVYLRPVAEELGWDVEAQGQDATLTRGTKTRTLHFLRAADGRATIPARDLGTLLDATVTWDPKAGAVHIA